MEQEKEEGVGERREAEEVFESDENLLLALTSASLFSSKSTISSASRRLEAIIRGVQPEESYLCT